MHCNYIRQYLTGDREVFHRFCAVPEDTCR